MFSGFMKALTERTKVVTRPIFSNQIFFAVSTLIMNCELGKELTLGLSGILTNVLCWKLYN
jgi:hypothetical protein